MEADVAAQLTEWLNVILTTSGFITAIINCMT
jgi:hypothetical protein